MVAAQLGRTTAAIGGTLRVALVNRPRWSLLERAACRANPSGQRLERPAARSTSWGGGSTCDLQHVSYCSWRVICFACLVCCSQPSFAGCHPLVAGPRVLHGAALRSPAGQGGGKRRAGAMPVHICGVQGTKWVTAVLDKVRWAG